MEWYDKAIVLKFGETGLLSNGLHVFVRIITYIGIMFVHS